MAVSLTKDTATSMTLRGITASVSYVILSWWLDNLPYLADLFALVVRVSSPSFFAARDVQFNAKPLRC
jgi:hypothetical protein